LAINWPAILKNILYTSLFSDFLPLVFFLLFKKNNKEKTLRVIFYYILYCIINDFLSIYFQIIHSPLAFSLLALFSVAEFTFFCLFYNYLVPPGLMKKSLPFIWIVFFLVALLDFFFIDNPKSFDSVTIGVESLFTIILCIYYLIIQIKGSNDLFVYSTSNFWIIITFLIYLSGLFFLYITAESMIDDKKFHVQYVIINSVFVILKNILLAVAMLMKPTPIQNKSQPKNDYRDELFSYKIKK
jgi:hypothetical protein